ncbi:MAG: SH3 domain-containing protein [Acidimicrobiia bacterium]|nr:SH3 domain-containing protein [Acidimicrobiia bacterium]
MLTAPTARTICGLALCLTVATSACTYESGNGVASADGTDGTTTSADAGPDGPLAFSVEGMEHSTWRVYNTDDGLNLRVAPGSDSESIGRLPVGSTVTTDGSVRVIGDVSWFFVDADLGSGWVHSGYLAPVDTDEAGLDSLEPLAAAALIDGLWPEGTEVVVAGQPAAFLREGPGGDIIVELVTGTPVTVTGTATEGWTEVRTSNLRGWIYTDLLAEVADDTDSPFPAATPVRPADDLPGVNIFDQPDGQIVSGLPENEVALVTGRSQNGWTEITHRGVKGWVRAVEVQVAMPAPPSLEPVVATIDGAGGPVTVHLGPSGLEPILDELDDGTEIMTTGLSTPTGWSEVVLDQVRTGWVPTIFLSF